MANSDFYAGIITALAIVNLHGQDTIYDEIVDALGRDVKGLVRHAIKNDELEFSGLEKHGYAQQGVVRTASQVRTPVPDVNSANVVFVKA